jgi:hypothetical protein
MKRDPGRISSFTFYPCMRKSHSKYHYRISPKEFHTEICLSLRNSKDKNVSPYFSRIASWNSTIFAGTVAQVLILGPWAIITPYSYLRINTDLCIFILTCL